MPPVLTPIKTCQPSVSTLTAPAAVLQRLCQNPEFLIASFDILSISVIPSSYALSSFLVKGKYKHSHTHEA